MALARWQRTIVDNAGNILPGAQLTVRREVAGAPLAVLYSDRDGAVPIGNPFQADSQGFAAFHAAGGPLRIDVTFGEFSRTLRYVPLGLQGESDAVLLDISYLFSDATTDADPGAGFVRFNNATLASVTKIFISETDDVGASLAAWLGRIDDYGSSGDRGVIVIRSLDGSAEFVGQVTGSVADDGAYRDITVTHLASAGTFTASMRVGVKFTPRGVDGSVTAAGTLTDNYLVTGDGTSIVKATVETFAGDLDALASTIGGTSIYRVGTGATNAPSGANLNGSHVVTQVWDTNSARQTYWEQNSNRVWTRSKASAAWSAWGTVGAGKQTIWVPASAMKLGAGPAFGSFAAGDLALDYIAFDPGSSEVARFTVAMPKGWNEGQISAQVLWMHPATSTNFTVLWQVFAAAFSNDDALTASFGSTALGVSIIDTGGTTSDLYISDESSAWTIGNSPQEGDLVNFMVERAGSAGSDTLAVDAYLIGVKIFYSTISNSDE